MSKERDGEAANPGPDPWCNTTAGQLILETINITAISTNQEQLLNRNSHVTGFQEHGATGNALLAAILAAKERGWAMALGPVDPELARNTAGVGIQTKAPLMPLPHKACTKAFEDAVATGRAAIHVLDTDGIMLMIAIVYGWTGGTKGSIACQRTDDLMAIIKEEFEACPCGPKLIMGDINGDLADFPTISEMLRKDGWADLGSLSHLCEDGPLQPTCHARATARATRRDYILANDLALPAVTGHRVDATDEFPTHQPVQIRMDIKQLKVVKRKVRKPSSAAVAFEEYVLKVCPEDGNTNEVRKEQLEILHRHMDQALEDRLHQGQGGQ
jgi:hypothetical protein